MGTFKKEDLPPLPEGAHLLSSSPRPPALLPMSFNPPLLEMRTTSLITRSNSSWATTAGPSLPGVTPATVLGIPGFQLQHPQPHSTQVTFGTTFSSSTAPTSPQGQAPPTIGLLPQTTAGIPVTITGISSYKTRNSHLSLYQKLRSLSLDLPPPDKLLGKMSMSDTSHPSKPTCHSTDSESRSGSEGGQVRQMTQTLPQSYSPRQNTSMESMEKVPSHPPSCRSTHSTQQTLILPLMMLSNAIHLYEMTRSNEPTDKIPEILVQAHYNNLFSYFAYELPFILAWGETKARNNYFMNQQCGLPSDQILQYKAGRNACLLYNEIH